MKRIPKIICLVIMFIHICTVINANDIDALITSILPNIMPDTIDETYYRLDPTQKNNVLCQFFEYNKWRMLPLTIQTQQLTQDNTVHYMYDLPVLSYRITDTFSLFFSLPNLEVRYISKKRDIRSENNHVYIPYIKTVSPGSINSQFAFKIIHADKKSYLTIGAANTGEILTRWHLKNTHILQGAFYGDDKYLVLITQSNNKRYMQTYTCGYTPEQMLCIMAYQNAKCHKKQLEILVHTKLFTSLINMQCMIAQKIKCKINNILKNN